jgi:hypothetical protein
LKGALMLAKIITQADCGADRRNLVLPPAAKRLQSTLLSAATVNEEAGRVRRHSRLENCA